jgi:cation-transporting ATPase 13A1
MCGDGTNDVGALKASHVGVSIVNDPEFEKKIEAAKDPSLAASVGSTGKKPKGTSAKERMARAMAELNAQSTDPTIVRLGDASIASPFTARRTSIDCVLTVLRQGRCTLVTTIQVFKVLALNCLVSAYMMSALYLRGLKQGDMQMTASALVTAGLFFFISQAKPMMNLAPKKPPSSVFCVSVAVSIAGQFIVHLGCLIATLKLCEQYIVADDHTMSADGKFQPNVVNSAVYMLSTVMQVNNFVVNYRGHPFTQSTQENTLLWRTVQGVYAALLIVAGGQLPPLNDFLQMAPFPNSNFQASLIGILVVNFALGYLIEKGCQKYME